MVVSVASGCSLHTPERAARQFVRELNRGVPPEGSSAFDRMRSALQLTESRARRKGFYRSARWTHKNNRISLTSSDVLRDPPDRFDLTVSWSPGRTLKPGLLEKLLGSPYGVNDHWESGWKIAGGVLEYRPFTLATPYLVYSSGGYIRDTLDFLESAELPKLPDLGAVDEYLEKNASSRFPERTQGEIKSQKFCLSKACVTRYSRTTPSRSSYPVGLEIALTDPTSGETEFASILRDLGMPALDHLIQVIFQATESFAVDNNFAMARARSGAVSIWRRVEAPRSWREHWRPDL